MKIVELDEVSPEQVFDLNALCFWWLPTPQIVQAIRKVDPRVPEYFSLYAVERDKVLSQVGSVIVPTETTQGRLNVGFIWGVCTRPEVARQGLAKKLMIETHKRLLDKGVRYSLLGAGRSAVAYTLYRKLGYQDSIGFRMGTKRCHHSKTKKSEISFTTTDREKTYVDLFREYAKGLLGFIHRPKNFIQIRNAWSWMHLNLVGVFKSQSKPIGYVLGNKEEKVIKIKELCCPDLSNTQDCLRFLENKYRPQYMIFEGIARDTIKDLFIQNGFKDIGNSWGIFMIMDIKAKHTVKRIRELYDFRHDRFQMSDIDAY